jgi:hypothetical protein
MVDTNVEPDLKNLFAWQAALNRQAEDLRSDIRTKQADLANVEERLSLVTKLIDVETRAESGAAEPNGEMKVTAPASRTPSDEPARAVPTTDLEQAVEEILRAAGAPLHISEIRATLIEQQVPIPGRGDDANVIVRLRRFEDRFTRTARGTYGLAEWGIPAVSSKTRKRRRTTAR